MIRDKTNPPMPTWPGNPHSRPVCDPLNSLGARVSSKLEEGNYRAVVRLTSSETSTAELDEATLAALPSKHPPSHPDLCIPPTSENTPQSPLCLRKRLTMHFSTAVGCTVWHLVAKCASSRVLPAMGDLLAPLQLGCGMPLGCEATVHATRLYVHNMTAGPYATEAWL